MAQAPRAASVRYVERFTLTERLLHWVHATAFFVLLGSGLVLYLPSLSVAIGRRPLLKDIHFWTGISWAAAILLITALGNRRALARTIREIDLFDRDDRRFLAGKTHSPQGRFNAGQKINAILTAAFATLFFISAEKPYDDYLDLSQVSLPNVMLAYEMDGKPLRREHGAPVRVVIPEMYGYKNVKWVERIELVAKPGSGYWEKLGYDHNAWIGHSNGYG